MMPSCVSCSCGLLAICLYCAAGGYPITDHSALHVSRCCATLLTDHGPTLSLNSTPHLHSCCIELQLVTRLGQHPERVGTCAVTLVDEHQAGHLVGVWASVGVHGKGLGRRHGAEQGTGGEFACS
jgi:hypothetical protein